MVKNKSKIIDFIYFNVFKIVYSLFKTWNVTNKWTFTNPISIYQNNITTNCLKVIEHLFQYSIELFSLNEFQYDITKLYYYVPHEKIIDENLLKDFYKNKGFYNVKIKSSYVKNVDNKFFELIIDHLSYILLSN